VWVFTTDVPDVNEIFRRYMAENGVAAGDLTALLLRLDVDCATVLGISTDGLYGCDFGALSIA
jgi:hypothetical protein